MEPYNVRTPKNRLDGFFAANQVRINVGLRQATEISSVLLYFSFHTIFCIIWCDLQV